MDLLLEIIYVLLGLVLLAKGADFLVDGSSGVARRFKIPEIIIGLTIVSIGTSLPEFVISVNAALKGENLISMGNIVGSNFANLFLVIGLCASIKTLHIKKQTRFVDQPLVVFFTIVLYLMVINDGIISRYEGVAMLLMMILYLAYNFLMAKYGQSINNYESQNEKDIEKEDIKRRKNRVIKKIKKEKSRFENRFPTLYAIIAIVLGIVLLKVGGDITVDNARLIALAMGLSEKLIAITIVAVGTSLPELITCIQATKKGETDLAIGNIAGSQIFNIILILGTSGAIKPIANVMGFREELLILIIGNIIYAITPFIGIKHKMGRAVGICFVLFYFAYMGVKVLSELGVIVAI
ncbi:MAG: calcium/sodium antiporter [Clostridia bacterium]|nr:calcium/sodium antiporter [Clostridia bacterium]